MTRVEKLEKLKFEAVGYSRALGVSYVVDDRSIRFRDGRREDGWLTNEGHERPRDELEAMRLVVAVLRGMHLSRCSEAQIVPDESAAELIVAHADDLGLAATYSETSARLRTKDDWNCNVLDCSTQTKFGGCDLLAAFVIAVEWARAAGAK